MKQIKKGSIYIRDNKLYKVIGVSDVIDPRNTKICRFPHVVLENVHTGDLLSIDIVFFDTLFMHAGGRD